MRIQPQSLRGSVRPGLPNNTTTTYSSTSPPAAGEQTKAAWIKMNTPATNDANQLLQAWSWFAGPGHLSGEDGWHPAYADGYACFGVAACQQAAHYLETHPNDVAGAKLIAATYCLGTNYATCAVDVVGVDEASDWVTDALAAAGGFNQTDGSAG
jgi:hypothetical protein